MLIVVGLALAGCGGSDSTSQQQQMMEEDEPTPAKNCGTGTIPDPADVTKCIPDPDAGLAEKNQAAFAALYAALDHDALKTFRDSDPDEDLQLYSETDAKDQDDYEKATVSMQGAKFNALTTSSEGDGVSEASDVLTLSSGVKKDRIEFSGVSTGQSTDHAPNQQGSTDFEIAGKYRGVDGKYKCTGGTKSAPCTTLVTSAGALNFGVGTWTFTATDKEQRISDSDIATYGWWTDTPTGGKLQAGLFSSRTIPTGSDDYAGGAGGGSATYKGDALGQYVISTEDHGKFTATVNLTATFAATDSLEGMINGFKGDDGKDRADWEVKLHKTNFNSSGTFVPKADDNNFQQARWNIGDTKGSKGQWDAALYQGTATKFPTYSAGEFSAQHGPTGRMIGAFGGSLEDN